MIFSLPFCQNANDRECKFCHPKKSLKCSTHLQASQDQKCQITEDITIRQQNHKRTLA